MRKRKSSLILGIILLLGVLGIGYAYLNTTLNISGVTDIDSNTWSVYWNNVQVKSGSVTGDQVTEEPTIDTNKTTVSFHVRLSQPGDYYEFTVDAVNDGSIDAMIETINKTINNSPTIPDYLTYTITYNDDIEIAENQLLAANTTETYKVRVEYKKNIDASQLPDTAQTLNLSFGINYQQSDSNAIEVLHPNSFATDDWNVIQNAVREGATSAYNVGDTRVINLSSYGSKTIKLVNKSTPPECEGDNFSQSACGFVIQFFDSVTDYRMNSTATNAGGWQSSLGRSFLNSTVYNSLPEDLKSVIINTKVISSYNPDHDSDYFITTDKLYLLDVMERFNYSSCSTNRGACLNYAQTRILDYYASGGSRPNKHYWYRTIWTSTTEEGFEAESIGWEVPCMDANDSNAMIPLFRIG